MKTKNLNQREKKIFTERYQYFVGIMLFLIVFESFYFEKRSPTKNTKIFSKHFWQKKFSGFILLLLILISHPQTFAGILKSDRYEGEEQYKAGHYNESIKKLQQAAVNNPEDPEIAYNLGNAYYKAGDFQHAEESWNLAKDLAKNLKNSLEKQKFDLSTQYNTGNAQFKQQKYKEAIDSYKKVLESEPNDTDAQYNLKIAEKKIEEQKKQQDQNKKEQENKDRKEDNKQNNNEQNKQESNKKNKTQEEEKNNEQNSNKKEDNTANKDKNEEEKQKTKDDEKSITKEQAQQILDAVEDNQKRALQKRIEKQLRQAKPSQNTKDW